MKMDKEKELPKRKPTRLNNFDYSTPGAYFVTVCTHNRKCTLSRVVGAIHESPEIQLTEYGKIVDRLINTIPPQSLATIDRYVIMPNHLHIMVFISADEYGRPQVAPTVDRMIKQFKGAVTKKIGYPIWQKSFIEHVIRNKQDFETRSKYIYENPIRWYYDELYAEE